MLFYEYIRNLPKEIRSHIFTYSCPKMDDFIKRGILVSSTHQNLLRASRNWNLLHNTNWENFIYQYYSANERMRIFNGLINCGCCLRHSTGFFSHFTHCDSIHGSVTMKKFNLKDAPCQLVDVSIKKCSCWCRHNMRHLCRVDDKLKAIVKLVDTYNKFNINNILSKAFKLF